MNWARLSWHLCFDSVRSQDSLSPRRRHIPRDDVCCILIMVCLCKKVRESLQHNAFPKFSSGKSEGSLIHWLESSYITITSYALFDCTCSGDLLRLWSKQRYSFGRVFRAQMRSNNMQRQSFCGLGQPWSSPEPRKAYELWTTATTATASVSFKYGVWGLQMYHVVGRGNAIGWVWSFGICQWSCSLAGDIELVRCDIVQHEIHSNLKHWTIL